MYKLIFTLITVFTISYNNSIGQSVYTNITEIGKVVFSKNGNSNTSKLQEQVAVLFNKYICEYYSRKKLPVIYLSIVNDNTSTSTRYELSYDNLYGNVLNNDNVTVKSKYHKAGINILVVNPSDNTSMLKILEYGISNLSELKLLYDKARKEGAETNAVLKVGPERIADILSDPTSGRILKVLSL